MSERLPPYRRNERLESHLERLNRAISGEMPKKASTELPILMVVGSPRSGATLLMQWLASSGAFAYPSNFIARFWSNPFIGALVQKMMVDPSLQFRSELADVQPMTPGFSSDLGKTEGFLAPHEFWYFWHRFFPFGLIHELTSDQVRGIDGERLDLELQALASVEHKPLVLKAHLLDWHIDFLASAVRGARFLWLDRDPFFVMQSMLEARRRYFGNDLGWYSIRPPHYESLLGKPPFEQVAGQIDSVRETVRRQLENLPSDRWMKLDYEDLCEDPTEAAARIESFLAPHALRWDAHSRSLSLENANTVRMDPEEERQLRHAYRRTCSRSDT